MELDVVGNYLKAIMLIVEHSQLNKKERKATIKVLLELFQKELKELYSE